MNMHGLRWFFLAVALWGGFSGSMGLAQEPEIISVTTQMGGTQFNAQQEAKEFEIPQGKEGLIVSYLWTNVPGEQPETLTRLETIFNATLDKEIKIAYDEKGQPLTHLPAGKYRFVVGGKPGASGTLKIQLVPAQPSSSGIGGLKEQLKSGAISGK